MISSSKDIEQRDQREKKELAPFPEGFLHFAHSRPRLVPALLTFHADLISFLLSSESSNKLHRVPQYTLISFVILARRHMRYGRCDAREFEGEAATECRSKLCLDSRPE